MGYTYCQDDVTEFCPFCQKVTEQIIESYDGESGKQCNECENDLLIPTVKGGEPFVFGNKVYTMQIGSDDEISIERYEN